MNSLNCSRVSSPRERERGRGGIESFEGGNRIIENTISTRFRFVSFRFVDKKRHLFKLSNNGVMRIQLRRREDAREKYREWPCLLQRNCFDLNRDQVGKQLALTSSFLVNINLWKTEAGLGWKTKDASCLVKIYFKTILLSLFLSRSLSLIFDFTLSLFFFSVEE